jgi:uncharacterized membrane protein YjjP (DUF1212 family)
MANGQRDEKEVEKREEKEEKWRRDPLSAVVWAAIFVWAGLVLLVDNLGLLVSFEGLEAWSLIFIGAGLIVLLEVIVRLLVPDYRRPVTGTFIFSLILLAIGLGNLVSLVILWPLVLIVIGLAILLRGLVGQR